MVTFSIDGEQYECVNLTPAQCRLLYEGKSDSYYLLVDCSLYKAEPDCGCSGLNISKKSKTSLFCKDIKLLLRNEIPIAS